MNFYSKGRWNNRRSVINRITAVVLTFIMMFSSFSTAMAETGNAGEKEAGLLSKFTAKNSTSTSAKEYAIEPAFDSETYEYKVTVPDDSSAFVVYAALSNEAEAGSTITAKWHDINGADKTQAITSGSTSGKSLTNFLSKGRSGNTLTIEVKSGEKTQNYVFNIVRTRSLSELTAATNTNDLTISPKFTSSVYEYSVNVPESTESIYVTPKAYMGYSDGYKVKVSGEDIQEGESKRVTLTDTVTSIPIDVYHTDGSKGTYTLKVTKVAEAIMTFRINPEDALVFLTDTNNIRILPDSEGRFRLISGEQYTYVITGNGYVGQKNTFTAVSGEAEINLDKAADNTSIDKTIESSWANFRGNNENNGVVDYKIPNKADEAILYWATKSGEGWDTGAPSSPILVDGYLIITSKTSIVKIDTTTGKIVASGTMVKTSSFNITPPTYADGMIFVALANGTVQAFNADTLESLWVYNDPLKGQPNSPITYHNGYIYTGFWNSETKDANFVCLSTADEDPANTTEEKLATWTYTHAGGFYWAGAYVCDNFVLVGTDDGDSGYTSHTSNLLSFNTKTGEVIDKITGLNADIRCTIAYDKDTDRYYFDTKGGSFYSVKVNKDGTIDKSSLKELNLGGMSTSTPVVYNGRAYVGVSGTSQFGAYSGHNITVIDLKDWKIAYTCKTQGYPQTSGLLTTAYEKESGYVYIYFIDNYTPGKIRVIKDKPGQTVMEEDESIIYAPILFTPAGAQAQYAICSPIADEYGTLYFKNDSANIMALGSKIESIEVTSKPQKLVYKEGESFDNSGMTVVAHLANGLTKDITKYVNYSSEGLTTADTDVTIEFKYVMYQDTDDNDNTNDSNNIGVEVKPLITAVDINVLSEADYNAVKKVESLIDSIGNITIDSKEAIKAARDLYNNLTEELQALVGNYGKLVAAEEAFTALEKTVDDVIGLIDAIGNVTLYSGDAIRQARLAYNKLADDLKVKVTNYAALEAAEEEYESISNVVSLIDAIPSIEKDNIVMAAEKIKSSTDAYNSLTDTQKAKISNYDSLVDKIKALAELNHRTTDSKTVISAEGLPWNVKIVVEPVTQEHNEKLVLEAGDKEIISVYDIILKDICTGETAKVPEEGIKITFTLENIDQYKNILVLHLAHDNNIEKIVPTIKGNEVSFVVKSLSPIAVTGEKIKPQNNENTDNVKTGDNYKYDLTMATLLISALGILLITKKRKAVK